MIMDIYPYNSHVLGSLRRGTQRRRRGARNATYRSQYDAKAFILLDDQHLTIPLRLGRGVSNGVSWLSQRFHKEVVLVSSELWYNDCK